jgi:hypothetical protein
MPVARVGLAALAICCLAAACGGKSTARRDAIATYIVRVDAIEQHLQKSLLDVSKANRDFAGKHTSSPAARRELIRAQATIRQLERRFAAVPAPADAAHLRALLLAFVAREQEIADEVVQLATFIPKFEAALTQLTPASVTVRTVLADKKATLADKAAALDRYGAALGPIVTKLAALHPPPASRPVWARQVSTLRQVRVAEAALADALRHNRSAAVPELLHRLSVAAAGNQTVAAQQAQIAAVVAYNARVKSLNTLGSRISDEEARLQRKLGS